MFGLRFIAVLLTRHLKTVRKYQQLSRCQVAKQIKFSKVFFNKPNRCLRKIK